MDQDIKRKFDELKEVWFSETINYSRPKHIIAHPAYEDIIDMGQDVLPLIIDEMKKELEGEKGVHLWFFALHKITNENPVPSSQWGDVREMAKTWIKWAEEKLEKKGSKVAQAV